MKFVNLQVGWGISRSVQDHNISGQCTVKSLADKSLKVWYVDLSDCDIPRFAVQRRCVHVYIQSYTYQRIYLYMYMYVRIVNHCRYILPYHVVYIYIWCIVQTYIHIPILKDFQESKLSNEMSEKKSAMENSNTQKMYKFQSAMDAPITSSVPPPRGSLHVSPVEAPKLLLRCPTVHGSLRTNAPPAVVCLPRPPALCGWEHTQSAVPGQLYHWSVYAPSGCICSWKRMTINI